MKIATKAASVFAAGLILAAAFAPQASLAATPVQASTAHVEPDRVSGLSEAELLDLTAPADDEAFSKTGIFVNTADEAADVRTAQAAGDFPDGDVIITPMSGNAASPIGTFSFVINGNTIQVPTGCFYVLQVSGTGLTVTRVRGVVECVGVAATFATGCNTSSQFQFKNSSGTVYRNHTTGVNSGCHTASYSAGTYNVPASAQTVRTGSICGNYRNNGTQRATSCLAVFP